MYTDYFVKMQNQPIIDAYIDIFKPVRIDNIYNYYVGLAYNASEICNNADDNIMFIPLHISFYNNEGANRSFTFRNTDGFVIIVTINIPTVNGVSMAQYVLFNNIIASGALVNAGTTLTFNGYRILT